MSDLPINQNTGDVTLYDESGNKVAVIQDGSIYRLAVDANIVNEVSSEKFGSKFSYDVPDLTLINGVDTTIKTVTSQGKIDFIQIVCKNSSYEFIFEVDSVEILRISMTDLGSIGLLSSNSTGIPIYTASASKIIAIHPNEPMEFKTNFTIKVKSTVAGNELDGWFIQWRELI